MNKIIALSVFSLVVSGMTGCQSVQALGDKLTDNKVVDLAKSATLSPFMTTATNYKNDRHMTIDGTSFPISETSARILTDNDGKPLLVDDIFAGQGDKAVAGYKIMVMNRTSSVAAEGRTLKDGKVIDNRMIHRGSKALIGIPVVGGKVALDSAVLLDLDIIYDDFNKPLADGSTFKPRGEKLTKKDVAVNDKRVVIRSLTLPNTITGESSGGGIEFFATATIEGKKVSTGANSAFEIFETAKDPKRF